jgi:hypothetical protein
MGNAGDVMILKIGAHPRKIMNHWDAYGVQVFARSNTGNLQQMRRVNRASA